MEQQQYYGIAVASVGMTPEMRARDESLARFWETIAQWRHGHFSKMETIVVEVYIERMAYDHKANEPSKHNTAVGRAFYMVAEWAKRTSVTNCNCAFRATATKELLKGV